MAASITISNTFATQAGPIPLSQLDTNYSQLVTAFNTLGNFFNYYADSSGSANALVVTVSSPQLVSYAAGLTLFVKVANTNTGASTINVNALGAKSITTPAIGALSAGDLIAGAVVQLTYDGTQFQLGSVGSFIALRATTLAVSGATTLSSNVTISGGTSITPSSGTALTLSPPSGQLAILVNDTAAGGIRCVNSGNTSGFDVGLLGGTSVADAYLYNRNIASGSLILGTKNSSRVNISLAGNVVIGTPDSGVALTVTGAAGNAPISASSVSANLSIFNSTSVTGSALTINYNGTTVGYIGYGAYPISGAANTDLGISVAGANNIRFGYNGGSNTALTISGSNGSVNVAYGFNITGTGGFYNSASKFGMDFNAGVTRFYSSGADASTRGAYDFRITDSVGTLDRSVLAISNQGAVSIAAPVSGTALAVTGTAAGTAALRLDTTATNAGTQTATWTAPTNKPGAALGVVSRWIPVNLDGTTYYIPAWT